MKRVCNSRFAKSALLLAVVLLVSGVGAPVWGRENISAGQSGDPTDGNGISSSGGNSQESEGTGSIANVRIASPVKAPELVLYVNGAMYRVDIHLLFGRWKAK